MNIFVEQVEDNESYSKRHIRNLCDRVWLREEFPIEAGWGKRFEFKSKNETFLEGHIIEKGLDEKGHYILFLFDKAGYYQHKKIERPHVTCGSVEFEVILSPEMIEGAERIVEQEGGQWPCFHESMLTIVDKSENDMILRFEEGFLGSPVV